MKREIHKVIQDKIPQQMMAKGQIPVTRQLSEADFIREAKKKLVEEAQEVLASSSREALLEELADVLEVFDALIRAEGISSPEIHTVRERKNSEKGAFEKKLFLQSVEA